MLSRPETSDLRCSFCHESRRDGRILIGGPAVFICHECVDVCRDIIADDTQAHDVELSLPLHPSGLSGPPVRCGLCGTSIPPRDVIPVPHRGVVCLGCAGEVEAAIATRRQSTVAIVDQPQDE
jgi:hypothetical protein